MQRSPSVLLVGIFALFMLGCAIFLGHWEAQAVPSSPASVAAEKQARDRQQIERRRGRIAEVAITGATTQ